MVLALVLYAWLPRGPRTSFRADRVLLGQHARRRDPHRRHRRTHARALTVLPVPRVRLCGCPAANRPALADRRLIRAAAGECRGRAEHRSEQSRRLSCGRHARRRHLPPSRRWPSSGPRDLLDRWHRPRISWASPRQCSRLAWPSSWSPPSATVTYLRGCRRLFSEQATNHGYETGTSGWVRTEMARSGCSTDDGDTLLEHHRWSSIAHPAATAHGTSSARSRGASSSGRHASQASTSGTVGTVTGRTYHRLPGRVKPRPSNHAEERGFVVRES